MSAMGEGDAALARRAAETGPVQTKEATEDIWPRGADGYELLREIGRGAFATVYLARCKQNNQNVAVKIMEMENVGASLEDVAAEVKTMRMCKHPNVLEAYCCFSSGDQLWLVMEYMQFGSCLRILHQMQAQGELGTGEGFTDEVIASVLVEVVRGLAYLHGSGWVHRDIKAGNILVSDKGEVKIADFGVAAITVDPQARTQKRHTFVGTPCWMAPEVIEKSNGYTARADIWSLGITALELAKGFAPYADRTAMQTLLLIIREDAPSLKTFNDGSDKKHGQPLKKLLKYCLVKDPAKRLSAAELLHKSTLLSRARPAQEVLRQGVLRAVPPLAESGPAPAPHLPSSAAADGEDGAGEASGAGAGEAEEAAPLTGVASERARLMEMKRGRDGDSFVDPSLLLARPDADAGPEVDFSSLNMEDGQ